MSARRILVIITATFDCSSKSCPETLQESSDSPSSTDSKNIGHCSFKHHFPHLYTCSDWLPHNLQVTVKESDKSPPNSFHVLSCSLGIFAMACLAGTTVVVPPNPGPQTCHDVLVRSTRMGTRSGAPAGAHHGEVVFRLQYSKRKCHWTRGGSVGGSQGLRYCTGSSFSRQQTQACGMDIRFTHPSLY